MEYQLFCYSNYIIEKSFILLVCIIHMRTHRTDRKRYNIYTMLHYFLDLIFPRACLGCGAAKTFLCGACTAKIFDRKHAYADHGIFASTSYKNDIVRNALWHLKYRHGKDVARLLAPAFAGSVLKYMENFGFRDDEFLVIPVPATKDRVRKRGFNQSECIARALAENLPANYVFRPDIVEKTKKTKPQTKCADRTERIKNLKSAFFVTMPEASRGKNFIVVDDVTTTGATLNEVRKTLKMAGAKNVLGIAVAH